MRQRIPIKSVCEIYDGPHATPKKTEKGPIYLGIDALTPDGRIDPTGFAFLSEEDYVTWTKRVTPQPGDIVFSYEATLGRYAIIPDGFYGCLGRRLAVIRNISQKINTKWLYYYFLSPEWTAFIKGKTIKGSTVDRISIEDFPDYSIPYIPIEEQGKIAKVLSSIDDRIDNNTRINDNLAQMAKTIYDYWFTQFDFPNTYNHPYCSSGGDMVWNDLLKQMIPAGWKVKRLNELCVLSLGGTPDTSNPDYWNGDINWLNSGEIAQFPVISSELKITSLGVKNSPAKLLPAGTVVVSITGNIRASIMAFDSCANQSVVGIHETDYLKSSYIYPMICNKLAYYTTISTGNCQKHINKGILDAEPVVIPSHNVLARYYSVVSPIYEEINQRAKETKELTDLRNWLLPMLMNGQATIED